MLGKKLKILISVVFCLVCMFSSNEASAYYVGVSDGVKRIPFVGAITSAEVAFTSYINVSKDTVNKKVALSLCSWQHSIGEDVHFSFQQTKVLIDTLTASLGKYKTMKDGELIATIRGIDTSLEIAKLNLFSEPYLILNFYEDHPARKNRNFYCVISDHDSENSCGRLIARLKLTLVDDGPKLQSAPSALDYFILFYQLNNKPLDYDCLSRFFKGGNSFKDEFERKRFYAYIKPYIIKRSRKLKKDGSFFVKTKGKLGDYDFDHKRFVIAGDRPSPLSSPFYSLQVCNKQYQVVGKYPSIDFNRISDPYFDNGVNFDISFLNTSEFRYFYVQPDKAEQILDSMKSDRDLRLLMKVEPRKFLIGKDRIGHDLGTLVVRIDEMQLLPYSEFRGSPGCVGIIKAKSK